MEKNEPKVVTEQLDCDYSRLFGTLAEAIAYLAEMGEKYAGTDICLTEEGVYDDKRMVFEYSRKETEEEIASRLEREREEEEEPRLRKLVEEEKEKRRRLYLKLKGEFRF